MNTAVVRYRAVGGRLRASGELGWHPYKIAHPTGEDEECKSRIGMVIAYTTAMTTARPHYVVVKEHRFQTEKLGDLEDNGGIGGRGPPHRNLLDRRQPNETNN